MRLHSYRGRENGLMIIGSVEELQSLGQALTEIKLHEPQPKDDWPRLLAEFEQGGQSFKISFHLESTGGEPPTNYPRSFFATYGVWILLILGALLVRSMIPIH